MALGNMSEIWKPIDGIIGYYVSNYGRVKADEVKTKFGKQNKIYPERFITPYPTPTGYLYIKLSISRKRYTFILHRLVATYFIANRENKPQVNHIDGDKNNNHYANLEWCTAAENLKHARDLGLNNSIGSNNRLAKFTKKQIFDIRASNLTITEIAIRYKASLSVISRIKSFKSYRDVI